jgi:chromosome segregation ATPase
VQSIGFKWEWNINTVAVLGGFASMFIAWGYTLAELREGRAQNAASIERLATSTNVLDTRLTLLEREQIKVDQTEYRMAQLEKGLESLDIRLNRVTESYSNQFADVRTQLSSISTQIALSNQTLQRIESRPVQTPTVSVPNGQTSP